LVYCIYFFPNTLFSAAAAAVAALLPLPICVIFLLDIELIDFAL